MTIQKKLVLSNILMIFIPVVLAMAFGAIAFGTYGDRYWDSMEEMYDDENGVYSAQSIIYAYKEELSRKEWSEYAEIEADDTEIPLNRTKKMKELEHELTDMGYHFRITIDGEEMYSGLTEQEEARIGQYFSESYEKIESLTLSDKSGAIIKNVFQIGGENCEIAAVSMTDQTRVAGQESYLKKYIISFALFLVIFVLAAIIVTNIILSRWISHMILKPLNILKKGTKEIAEGNLDFELPYGKKDEFGEVCREFDQMRGRLKESVETRLQYEQYRKKLIIGISHDLRTPLTSIKGYVEGLKDGIANTQEKKERYYDAIHVRALDMEALVDSLSTFARLENKQYRYQMEMVNMDEYLRQLVKEYQEEANHKGVLLIYDNQSSNPEVFLDIQEMHRVFINLFENSTKYRIKAQSVIHVFLENHNDRLEIRVADDGPGVPEDEREHIFTSFYRVDESRTRPESGSGLGLSIAKQIVEGHKGTIHAYNENGLVILITLPTAHREAGMEV